MLKFEVGKMFPGPIPDTEGPVIDIWPDGLILILQFPNLTPAEFNAFERGFSSYSYYESPIPIPIPIWVFNFSPPIGTIDANYSARATIKDSVDNYLNTDEGIKNALTLFLLDHQILKGIKLVGLDPKAITLFQRTIRMQLLRVMEYGQEEYDQCLKKIYRNTPEQLYLIGTKFNK